MDNKKVTAARNPDATRSKILDAALDVFASKSYHDASVDEIVERSQTSKGSVYFHFPNKERLFLALVDKFANLLERRVTEEIAKQDRGIQRVKVALETVLDTFSRYRGLTKILLIQAVGLGTAFEEKRLEVHARFASLIRFYLDETITVGDIQPVDTEIVAFAWMGAINEVIIRWVYTGTPERERILHGLLPVLLRSVGFNEAD